jgi:hypothetical protein
LDPLYHVFTTDNVGAGCFGLAQAISGRDHRYPLGFAQAVRQDYGSAHHLIGMLGIYAQTKRKIDGFVELRVLNLFKERNCVRKRVRAVFDLRAHLRHVFADFLCHASSVSHRLDCVAIPPWCWPLLLLSDRLTCAWMLLKTHF